MSLIESLKKGSKRVSDITKKQPKDLKRKRDKISRKSEGNAESETTKQQFQTALEKSEDKLDSTNDMLVE